MPARNDDAPGRQPQGVRNANKPSTSRRNSNTRTSRLPSSWRNRLPEPARVYRQKLAGFDVDPDGGEGRARCPFHDDPKRSFRANLMGEKGGWRCSTCDRRGDIIDLIKMLENCPFTLAVRWLIDWKQSPVAPSPRATAHIAACRVLLGGPGSAP